MSWLNLLTDVTGLGVGQASDESCRSGVTAICCLEPMVAAAHCCGGAPATRETDLLYQDGLVERVDAVLFCGGSAFGLAAADGALEALEKHKRGFATSTGRVPIVPAAAIFDLFETTSETILKRADYKTLGAQAVELALSRFSQPLAQRDAPFALGNAGAGLGARAGGFKGGVGSASDKLSCDNFIVNQEAIAQKAMTQEAMTQKTITIGALAVVNAFGSPAYADLSALRAWSLEQDGEFGGLAPDNNTAQTEAAFRNNASRSNSSALLADKETTRQHTTLCLVAFDCALPKSALRRIAQACQGALALALHPSLTLFDGDIVFALAKGRQSARQSAPLSPALLAACEQKACETLARAIAKGVWYAESTTHAQSFQDAHRARKQTL